VVTKYRSEPKGRRNFDTALHCDTVDMIVTEKTRTAKSAVRAACFSGGNMGRAADLQKTQVCATYSQNEACTSGPTRTDFHYDLTGLYKIERPSEGLSKDLHVASTGWSSRSAA
jgi:hypothetical protein